MSFKSGSIYKAETAYANLSYWVADNLARLHLEHEKDEPRNRRGAVHRTALDDDPYNLEVPPVAVSVCSLSRIRVSYSREPIVRIAIMRIGKAAPDLVREETRDEDLHAD